MCGSRSVAESLFTIPVCKITVLVLKSISVLELQSCPHSEGIGRATESTHPNYPTHTSAAQLFHHTLLTSHSTLAHSV